MARILIIDDNHDMLQMLQMILEKRGQHEVITCHNGQQGLDQAFANLPDLAIVDVMMPGMSGYDVVKELRADSRTQDIGIFVLTARGQKVDKEAALDAGADGHIAKPVKMEDLLVEVEALLKRKRRRRPPQPQVQAQRMGGVLLPLFSLRGGIGVTTLAANLAVLLQQIAPTILLDLSPNSGHSTISLGLRPEKHWGHYLDRPNLPVKSLLLEHPTGLKLISAPPMLYQKQPFDAATLDNLLAQLSMLARFIVVDMPPVLDDTSALILEQAYRIVLISGDDLPSIQTTRATLQAMQSWIKQTLLIRNTCTPGPHPPPEALQQALRVRLAVDIPYEPTQSAALRHGTTLAGTQPKSPLVISLKKLAQQILAR
jgi:CheY-like chemotaxis protein